MGAARHDLADFAIGQRCAIGPGDAQGHALDRVSDRAGMIEPFAAGHLRDRPSLGRPVIFEDHRPQPVDHRLLERRRARAARVEHHLQRGKIVARTHRFGQREHALEHRGHGIKMRDAMAFDVGEQFPGVEAGRQHEQITQVCTAMGKQIGCIVIERRRDQHAGMGIEAEHAGAHPLVPGGLPGRGGLAAHALGMAGGARGVDQRLRRGRRRAVIGRVHGDPRLPFGHAGRWRQVGRGDTIGCGDRRRCGHRYRGNAGQIHGAQKIGMADEPIAFERIDIDHQVAVERAHADIEMRIPGQSRHFGPRQFPQIEVPQHRRGQPRRAGTGDIATLARQELQIAQRQQSVGDARHGRRRQAGGRCDLAVPERPSRAGADFEDFHAPGDGGDELRIPATVRIDCLPLSLSRRHVCLSKSVQSALHCTFQGHAKMIFIF